MSGGRAALYTVPEIAIMLLGLVRCVVVALKVAKDIASGKVAAGQGLGFRSAGRPNLDLIENGDERSATLRDVIGRAARKLRKLGSGNLQSAAVIAWRWPEALISRPRTGRAKY